MATPTYVQIATTTLASSASSVLFAGIPTQDLNGNDLRDLVLVIEYEHTTAFTNTRLTVNGASSGYSSVYMLGTGSSESSSTGRTDSVELGIYSPNTGQKVLASVEFLDYTATDKHKSMLIRADNSARSTEAHAARLATTSAIDSLSLAPVSGSYAAGSTFSLFGISGVAV